MAAQALRQQQPRQAEARDEEQRDGRGAGAEQRLDRTTADDPEVDGEADRDEARERREGEGEP